MIDGAIVMIENAHQANLERAARREQAAFGSPIEAAEPESVRPPVFSAC